ncbi:MAG: hypothetical protein AAB444_00250 [Patescibacteria group bacterium]
MKMQLSATYEPVKDAENYIRAIFDAAYMPHGYVGLTEKLLGMIEIAEIKDILMRKGDRAETMEKITVLLAESHEGIALDERARQLEDAWGHLGDQVIFQLEVLYGREWPFEAVHVDLTTLPICPYDFKARRIFVNARLDVRCQLRILSHELNHFLFYAAYSNDLFEKLGREKFELLKESMTIFTNPEQVGKPNEEPLRKLYVDKGVMTIGEAVDAGVNFLLSG